MNSYHRWYSRLRVCVLTKIHMLKPGASVKVAGGEAFGSGGSLGQVDGALTLGLVPLWKRLRECPGLFHHMKTQRRHSSMQQVKWNEVDQSCLTLCDPMVCSLPGSSIHGIFQARVLEWVATAFSRGSSWPRDQIRVSCIAGRRFTVWATRVGTKSDEAMILNFHPQSCQK